MHLEVTDWSQRFEMHLEVLDWSQRFEMHLEVPDWSQRFEMHLEVTDWSQRAAGSKKRIDQTPYNVNVCGYNDPLVMCSTAIS